MTTTVPAAPAATSSAPAATTLDPSAGQRWRRARAPVAVAVLVLLAGLAAALTGGRPNGLLDPRAADPSGSRAIAEVLRDQGVEVHLVRTAAAMEATTTSGDTLLVANPELLVESQVARVMHPGADVVLVSPATPERFAVGLELAEPVDPEVRSPGCGLAAAARAGRADAGGRTYRVDVDAESSTGESANVTASEGCYSLDGEPSLVRAQLGSGGLVTVIGNPAALTNERFDDEGNAALVLGLLGAHPRLVWYLPSASDVPAGEQRSLYDLVPDGIWWGLLLLGVAVLLLALGRARRLGPVVAEPLPVVVRATEAVEGRGRLYRRSAARDKASGALRAAALSRLVPSLGLGRRADPEAVVDAVARRTRRTTVEVTMLLYGAAPVDDAALVRLADDLDDLEREVRRP